jgi:hypothetical protein
MFRSRYWAGAVAVTAAVAVAACGSSTSNGSAGTSSTGAGASSGTGASGANVAAATAAVRQFTGKPTAFPVDQPLRKRPTGETYAYLECSTPVCGLFAQLLAPTQKLLGYKLDVVKAGASASSLQSAMESIMRLPGSSWNFDGDPTGIVMVRR